MTTLTQPMPRFANHPVTSALLVVFCWIVAAAMVIEIHLKLDSRSPAVSASLVIGVLLLAGFAYMRLLRRQSGITHALTVGIVWLTFSILTEIVLTTRLGQGWFYLLGTPDRPLLRNLYLFVWIFAPAIFAPRMPADS